MTEKYQGLLDKSVTDYNAGHFARVISGIRTSLMLTSEEVYAVDDRDFVPYMLIVRLLGASEVSQSQAELTGDKSLAHLNDATKVFSDLYDHPRISKESVKTNLEEGNEQTYNLRSEMMRDMGRRALYTYHLLGNSGLLDEAINYFSQAISLANPNSSTMGVATMEAQIASFEKNHQIDLPLFNDAYDYVLERSKDWNRVGTVSRWYAYTSLKNKQYRESWKGIKNMTKAVKGHVNPVYFFLKELGRPLRDQVRRLTLSHVQN